MLSLHASQVAITPPPGEHDWLIGIEWPDGRPTHIVVPPDAPLRKSVSVSLLWGGKRHLWCDGARLSLEKTPRENGLQDGAVLELHESRRGGAPGDAIAGADDVAMAEASESDDDEALSQLSRQRSAGGACLRVAGGRPH